MTVTAITEIVINGTWYDHRTDPRVVEILERYRMDRGFLGSGARLRLEYGDPDTGRSWGDFEAGYIGRSTGTQRILLVVHNTRCIGGPAILTHCIVRITECRGNHLVWQHPRYHRGG